MSDLEQRLTDALIDGAQDAPAATGLAAAARSRARSRRRTRVAGLAAALAVAVGVPTAIVAAQDSDSDGPPPRVANDANTDPGVPDGYRVESWHDVSIAVPGTWGYGSPGAWCAGGGSLDTPRVSRPGAVSEMIACSPENGYGITFQEIDNQDDFQWPVVQQPGNDSYPPDAFVGGRGIGGVLVMVTAPTQAAGLDVLATMRSVGAQADANGCPVDSTSEPVVRDDAMTVCRYDDVGLLEQSELLSGADLEAAELALESAPEATATDCDAIPAQTIRLASVAGDAGIDLSCGTLVVHGEARGLTEDALYWALSPGWSGSVPDGVPLPSELRSP